MIESAWKQETLAQTLAPMGLSGSFRSSSVKLSAKLGSIRQLAWPSDSLYLFSRSTSCAASASLSLRVSVPSCIDCQTIIVSTFASYAGCDAISLYRPTSINGCALRMLAVAWNNHSNNNANMKSSILQTTNDSLRRSHYWNLTGYPEEMSC